VVLCLLLTAACTSGPAPPAIDDRPYDARIQTFRSEKDAAFRAGSDSPIPAAERAAFPGLSYFAIDPHYHVPAFLTVDPTAAQTVITLQTSSDVPRKMRRVGRLGFSLGDASYTLTAFADLDDTLNKRLFVPFADLTGGSETYKGGRYLDLDRTPTGIYDLDFNRAYHPYCVYNPTYECPVPPRENRLPLAIRAGERLIGK
jgi:uncharacterized protein (DUF1684 family)